MTTGIVNPYSVAAGFDVVNDIPWHTLYWADGPAMAAVGTSNFGKVTRIPDEMGTTGDDLVPFKGTSTGITYRSQGGLGMGGGAFNFDNTETDYLQLAGSTTAWTKGAVMTGGSTRYTVVSLGYGALDSNQANARGFYSSAGGGQDGVSVTARLSNGYITPSGGPSVYAGVTNQFANNTLYAFLHDVNVGGSRTKFYKNGSSINTQTGTMLAMPNVRLGSKRSYSQYSWRGRIALWGIVDGYLRGSSEFADLKAWFQSYYGVASL